MLMENYIQSCIHTMILNLPKETCVYIFLQLSLGDRITEYQYFLLSNFLFSEHNQKAFVFYILDLFISYNSSVKKLSFSHLQVSIVWSKLPPKCPRSSRWLCRLSFWLLISSSGLDLRLVSSSPTFGSTRT